MSKTYHTVVRLEHDHTKQCKVVYRRIEDDYYESAKYYEEFYRDQYSYPTVVSVIVVNQFITED
jgi:hypothetical protein